MSAAVFAPRRGARGPARLQALALGCMLGLAALLGGCGGGGGGSAPATTTPTPTSGSSAGSTTGATGGSTGGTAGQATIAPGPNVVPVVLDGGTDGSAFNSPFVTVTVCTPGTQTCTTIDHVLVDTGSSGLRILASALGGATLPAEPAPTPGTALGECAQFASGFSWGAVRRADIQISGEAAGNLPVQVINDAGAAYATVPAACSNTGVNFGVGQGAKGLLGVGFETRDCPGCARTANQTQYFACTTAGACTSSVAPLTSQVAQPVAAFPTDNNGLLLSLPAVPATGAATLNGSLVFGISTRDNNALGSTAVYGADSKGNFSTTYKGANYNMSFLDSGSNGLFFDDNSIVQCTGASAGFYCPPTPLSLSATITGAGLAPNSTTVGFTVTSLNSLDANATVGPVGGTAAGLSGAFDWGLPFFLGRNVFLAIRGASTPAGLGPYWAF